VARSRIRFGPGRRGQTQAEAASLKRERARRARGAASASTCSFRTAPQELKKRPSQPLDLRLLDVAAAAVVEPGVRKTWGRTDHVAVLDQLRIDDAREAQDLRVLPDSDLFFFACNHQVAVGPALRSTVTVMVPVNRPEDVVAPVPLNALSAAGGGIQAVDGHPEHALDRRQHGGWALVFFSVFEVALWLALSVLVQRDRQHVADRARTVILEQQHVCRRGRKIAAGRVIGRRLDRLRPLPWSPS